MKRRPIDGKFFDSKAKGSSVSNKERWIDYLLGPSGALLVNAILGGSFLNIFYTDVIGIGNLWKGMFLAVFPIVSKILDATAETLPAMLQQIREHGFHEGSSMRKIGDTYYYIFTDTHRGKPTALGYATSKNPLGPFTYQGVIIDNDGCDPESWNNHGSIECVNGQWTVFYHRSTANSRYLRRMCAEPITIDENGLIPEVRPSSIGMGEAYRIDEPLYGYQACKLSKNAWIDGDKLIVKKGRAEVTYRYVDTSARCLSSVSYEGTGNASVEYRLDAKGELTLSIETDQTIEIKRFNLNGQDDA